MYISLFTYHYVFIYVNISLKSHLIIERIQLIPEAIENAHEYVYCKINSFVGEIRIINEIIYVCRESRCRRNWYTENRRRWARAVFTALAAIKSGRKTAGGTRARRYTQVTLWCQTSRRRRRMTRMSSPCRYRIRRRHRLRDSRSPYHRASHTTNSRAAAH